MKRFLLLFLLISSDMKAHQPLIIDIISSENFSERYSAFVNGRDIMDITDFSPSTDGSHLEIIEMILLQQALYLGGETKKVEFRPRNWVNTTEFDSLIDGSSLMLARTMWHEDLLDYRGSLYVSDAVIEFGQYEAGLYVSVDNQKAQALKPSQLNRLTVVVNPRWHVDWRALVNTPVSVISYIGPWEDMLAMVETQVVDAMMINFSVSDHLDLNFEGKLFTPLKKLKVILPDTRHFAVSKAHPQGKQVAQALQRGLAVLSERGVIKKALQQSGFINHLTSDWQAINQQMVVSER
ncbi:MULTISPECIES: hypothetical protein [unclassified Pseudoalteromonas]|uniref:hypothetical protein n=1 Tax=unclassified Pseudoalteromonas TaxID=194690 RepID=UPI000C088191|nr:MULTISPECIES: hypothetical protein [unclassified Pseudoalteromonas]MDP2635732.1 hypothetical protein [Pseudoalteromonas sp. 1_MG-2023]PHN91319.1 hypothetical protein CSC79_03420 [Pseudoalteromonas sp. 3D05]TGE86012.1 hypothetical protein C7Y70_00500 [Pseudoalteromonas sp. KS88]